MLDGFGVPYTVLDRAACVAAEPGLWDSQHRIVGGLRLPGDETGDAHQFTQRLAALAMELGVQFRYGTTVERLVVEGGRVAGIATAGGLLTADATVVALGSYSPALLRPAGAGAAGLPGQGLLADRADHQPGRRARVDRHGRDLQGGDHPAG